MKKYLKDKILDLKLPYTILDNKKDQMVEIERKINRLDDFLKVIDNEDYFYALRVIEDIFKDLKEERSNTFEVILKLKIAINKGASIKLTESQIKAYDYIINLIKEKIDELTEQYCNLSDKYNEELEKIEKSNKDIERYERYLSIYDNYQDYIDESLINEIYEDDFLSNAAKIDLLTKISLFNERVENGYKKMSTEKLEELLPALKLNNDYNNYKELLTKKYSYESLKEIIDYINQNKKLNFEFDMLMNILIAGTSKKILENSFNKIMNSNINLSAALQIQSFWIENYIRNNQSGHINSSLPVTKTKRETNTKTKDQTYYSNHENVFDNIALLKRLNIYDPTLNRIRKVLEFPTSTIIKNKQAAELYRIKIIPSVLTACRLMDNCDVYTELGHRTDLDCSSSYVNSHPKRFANIKRCQVEGIDYLGARGTGFNSSKIDKDSKSLEECYSIANIVEPALEKRNEYDEFLLANSPNTINNAIYYFDIIKYLEENNKKSEYEYIIGNCIVSRLKVLRIMSQIVKAPCFDLDSAIKYAVFYNTYYTFDEVKEIDNNINNIIKSIGGNIDEKSKPKRK